MYGNTYSFGPNQHHGSTKAFLAVVKNGRLGAGRGQTARLLKDAFSDGDVADFEQT
jgi:hypothetical protein